MYCALGLRTDFFRHISRWRADPTRQSGASLSRSPRSLAHLAHPLPPVRTAANPSPDYYAEKVGSLRQYRTWVRLAPFALEQATKR